MSITQHLPGFEETAFDDIIDVRSPAEFEEDHVPGAISLPALSNVQRAEVGRIYKQQGAFFAKRIGAAYVSENIAGHLHTALKDKSADYRPLVYCWRGGQRSNSVATVLKQIGWRAEVLTGGYRTWRRFVLAQNELPLPFRIIAIDGPTGSAKTKLLAHLRAAGGQVIDLEGLANHKGSLLGRAEDPQPAQKLFESRFMAAMLAQDPARPVFVEAESPKIGNVFLPPQMAATLRSADSILLDVPDAARVQHLLEDYPVWLRETAELKERLGWLKQRVGGEVTGRWHDLIDAGQWPELVQALLNEHYDPSYAHSQARAARPMLSRIRLDDLSERALASAAREIIRLTYI